MSIVRVKHQIILIPCIVITSVVLLVVLSNKNGATPRSQISDAYEPTTENSKKSNLVDFDYATTSERFNVSGEDQFVLLHIQKTGGTTFEKHLVQDIILDQPCSCSAEKRRCNCPRRLNSENKLKSLSDLTWLISRFSTGWVCGLHPDITQLQKCLAEAKSLYFLTFLRHPLHRFISEFRHVLRGATWKASKGHCIQFDTRLCYEPRQDWSHATLDEFLSCSNNMAINRQTRMLASYNTASSCDQINSTKVSLLSSAKENLKKLAFFGICERQRTSQVLFEKTFDLRFKNNFRQSEDNKTQLFISDLSQDMIDRIIEKNSLDMQLYEYATHLFAKRCLKLTGLSDCGAPEGTD